MIQRIQTVYLLIITVLGVLILCFPIIGVCSPDVGLSKIYAFDFLKCLCVGIGGLWGKFLAIMAILIPVVALFAIFMFKKRSLQVLLSVAIIFLVVLFYLFGIMFFVTAYRQISQTVQEVNGCLNINFSLIFFLHIINLVLSILTIRAIRRDEKLVKSLDRIR